jgi:putative oxidoreductase
MTDPISTGLLVLRIGLGIVFLAHGVKHLLGREKTTAWFRTLGFRAPGFQWLASTATEIGAGMLLIVGLGTGLAAAGVIGIMFVAFWTVHRVAGFFITAFMRDGIDVEGYEYVAMLSVAAVALAVAGPGDFSVDASVTIGESTIAELLDGWAGFGLVLMGLAGGLALLAVFWRPQSADT